MARADQGPGYYPKRIVATKDGKPTKANIAVAVGRLWSYKGNSPLIIRFHPPVFITGVMVDKGQAPDPQYGGPVEAGANVKRFTMYLPWADTKDYNVDFILPETPTVGTLTVRAFEGSAPPKELIRRVVIQGAGTAQFTAPFTIQIRVGTYVLTAYYKNRQQTRTVHIKGGVKITVDFNF